MPLTPGTRLGPYEIVSALGEGGMGEVYRAHDTRLDRAVAVKVLPVHVAHEPEVRQRFEREARTLATLSHPHICPVFDVGQQDGDVSADGQRFLMSSVVAEANASPISLILGWRGGEAKRRSD